MELVESIEFINNLLAREFGRFHDNKPNWRVSLAGELTEKRKMYHTDEGLDLLYPEVREVRKYQHIKPNYYVLERHIPIIGQTDLVEPISDEPAWTFQDRHGEYLPPRYEACKFIIENIYAAENNTHYVKYRDKNETLEEQALELKKMEELLFGNETPVGDALAHGYGVTVPGSKIAYLNPTEKIQ